MSVFLRIACRTVLVGGVGMLALDDRRREEERL
jgi:hypothetical protein